MTPRIKSSLLPSVSTLFNDLFDEDRLVNLDWTSNGWSRLPSANVTENDDNFVIELAAPGMKKNDFKVDIEQGQLCISSEKEEEIEEKEKHYTRREFNYTSFSRTFTLPESVDPDKIKAKYTDGILRLELPKKPEAKKMKKKAIAVG